MGHLVEVYLDYTIISRAEGTPGSRHNSAAPHECYRAKGEDSWVSIAVTSDEEWKGFCGALGNPCCRQDTHFTTSLDRHATRTFSTKALGMQMKSCAPTAE